MTKEEALKKAEQNLNYVTQCAYGGYADPGKALGMIALAKAQAASAYIEMAKMLSGK